MKKILLFLLGLSLLATRCATQKSSPTTPLQAERGVASVYYNGNDEPVTGSMFLYKEEQ